MSTMAWILVVSSPRERPYVTAMQKGAPENTGVWVGDPRIITELLRIHAEIAELD